MPIIIKETGILQQPITVIENFAKRFIPDGNNCWEWKSHIGGGYGRFWFNGRYSYAHRVMWELVTGGADRTKQLDHLCRNTLCVNPKHLEEVTAVVNILRSGAQSAINIKKTVCAQGHPLNAATVYIIGSSRKCKKCQKEWSRVYHARALAARRKLKAERNNLLKNKEVK